MGKQQKSRTKKTSSDNGIKHRKSPQTPVQKILLNGGMMVGVAKRYAGK